MANAESKPSTRLSSASVLSGEREHYCVGAEACPVPRPSRGPNSVLNSRKSKPSSAYAANDSLITGYALPPRRYCVGKLTCKVFKY
jgi:hypothetical protein